MAKDIRQHIVDMRSLVNRETRLRPIVKSSASTRPSSSSGIMFIAEVDSDAAGGGYYNCHLQTLDATDWNTDTADQFDDTGDSVVVLNLAENGEDVHNLDAGNKIICFKMRDDEGNVRLVGNEVFGRNNFDICT